MNHWRGKPQKLKTDYGWPLVGSAARRDRRGTDQDLDALLDEASREELKSQLAAESETFEVYPENWEAVEVILACGIQWVYAGMGERVGLSYPAVEAVMRMLNVAEPAETFLKVRTIEIGALEAWAEQR